MLVFCAVLYCLPVFDGRRITRWVLAPETLFLELTARPAVASWGHAAWVAVLGVPSVLTLPLQILYAGGSRFFALKTYELFLKVSGHLILQNILYKRACSSVFRRSSANQSRWGAILIIPPPTPPPHNSLCCQAVRLNHRCLCLPLCLNFGLPPLTACFFSVVSECEWYWVGQRVRLGFS